MRSAAGLSISGTLAADALDLAALIGPPPVLFDAAGDWSSEAVLPKPIGGLDLDLRVSATRATWGGHEIDDAAAAVSQRSGRFSVKLLDSGLAHGSLTGEFWTEDERGHCESGLTFSLENADLGALATEFGVPDFAAGGLLKASVNAHGRSPADIVASVTGEGSLEMDGGVLQKLNFEEALRRAQHRLIDVGRDMNAGATRFGVARGRVEIGDGKARFVDMATKAPGLSLGSPARSTSRNAPFART